MVNVCGLPGALLAMVRVPEMKCCGSTGYTMSVQPPPAGRDEAHVPPSKVKLLEVVIPLIVRGELLTFRSDRMGMYHGDRLIAGPTAAGLILATNRAEGV